MIQGVRSFDPDKKMTIQFYTPLTLIVGYNGSGKTTIVECLKYATTGELPPNSKGGAFIHDPQLTGQKDVSASTMLQFYSTTNLKMVVSRRLQLTVKKNTRSMKTLEGNLVKFVHGERSSISSRVAELDMIVPGYLGVPTAILDNVIFCHQDESLWPMSEPSVLKKKFDEIFEAQKYTKAIDNIKQLRKKQNEELGKLKITEQHTKEEKDRAARVERSAKKIQAEIEDLRHEVERTVKAMGRARDLADKAWKESESFAQILGQLEGRRIEAQGKRRNIEGLRMHLKEVTESDEWLENTLERYEMRLEEHRRQQEVKNSSNHELKRHIQENRGELGKKQKKYGEYENDKAQYERNLVRRQNLVKDVAQQHSIRGFDDSVDEDVFSGFMRRLRKLLKDQNSLLNRVKQEGAAELREAQTLRNQLDRREEALQHDKQSARQQMSTNTQEIASYQAKADQIAINEGSKAVIESKIEDASGRLQKVRESSAKTNRDEQLSDANAKLRSQEEESSRLNEELIQGTKKASDMAHLDHLKKELKDRNRSLETMIGAHRTRIDKLIGPNWEPSTVETLFQSTCSERAEALQSAERRRDGTVRELEQVEFRLKTVRASLKQKKDEATKAKATVRDAIGSEPEEYDEVLDERQKELELLISDAGQFAGLKDYMQKCLGTVESNKCCRTCQRAFRNDTEISNFKRKIEALLQKADREADAMEIKRVEDEIESIRNASSDFNAWKRLSSKEIPELEKQEHGLDVERETLIAKIEDHDQIVSQKAEAKRDIDSLSKSITTVSKYDSEIKEFEKQIQSLSAKQSQSQNGQPRTLEDIRDEIANISEQTRSTKYLINKLSGEREQARAEISELELQLSQLRNELASAGFEMERKAAWLSRIEQLKAANGTQRETINKADNALEKLAPEIAQAKARHDDVLERTQQRESEVQRNTAGLADSVHQLDMADEEIRSYIERDGPRELARAQREIQNVEDEIRRLESEQSTVSTEIGRIETELRDSESTRRGYSDNLRYRQEVRALEAVEAEITNLASHNAEIDRDRFQQESRLLTKEHNELSARQAGIMGEMKSKDVHLGQLLSEWDLIKDAAVKYRESHIRVETTKAAVEDLGRYGGALDKAIMTYHGMKMEEINRIIEELWRDTYQGTDVDTILIRSDNENAKGNRSYNYRVCMVKQEVEMDMRGRCSAGQKVLASIIIRLALAECFGINCGVMALDEPTTNLDKDNIRALALSLHNIIKNRQSQANFQLIVITHDEEFLRYMRCGEFADYYYKVTRDGNQKSVIEYQSIAEVL